MEWRLILGISVIYCFCLLSECPAGTHAQTTWNAVERNLFDTLFQNYNKEVRPTYWHTLPVTTYQRLFPIQMKEVSEKNQAFSVYGLLITIWVEPNLAWNPANYSGLEMITVDYKKLWIAPIGLYNSVNRFYDSEMEDGLKIRLNYDGRVEHQLYGVFSASCDMNTRKFPFDSHICDFQFSSPSMDTRMLEMYPGTPTGNVDMELYQSNGQWEVTNTSIVKDYITAEAAPGLRYASIRFKFFISRKNIYHIYNIIVPLILTNLLVPMLFLLPADCGEKLGLGVTVLLALSVFLLTLSETTPETSNYIPILTIFVTIQLVITALSIICSTLILKLHHNTSQHRPPAVIRTIFLGYVARMLCLGDLRKKKDNEVQDVWAMKTTQGSLHNIKAEVKKEDELRNETPANRMLLEYLGVLAQRVKDEDQAAEFSEEWKTLAYVFDWICFWIFTLTILISLLVIFVQGRT